MHTCGGECYDANISVFQFADCNCGRSLLFCSAKNRCFHVFMFHVRPLQRMSARFTCLQQQTLKISHSGAKIDEMTSVHRLFRKNICKSDGNKQLQSGEGQHTCVETHTPIVFCVNPHASASSTNVSHSAL